jgi:hypothetical protein
VKTCKERKYRYTYLELGTGWKWVASFTLQSLYRGERAPGAQRLGGWLGLVGLDTVEKGFPGFSQRRRKWKKFYKDQARVMH